MLVRRLLLSLTLLLVLGAALPRVARDIPYTAGQKLDIYSPADGQNHPVVLWVHGGGWSIGDKGHVASKPAAFNGHGFVFVRVGYTLHPRASFRQQAQELSRAIRWTRDHIKDYGGNPDRLYLMGHSAGAHLAALVSTDERYLQAEGLSLSSVRGTILLDGAAYDVPTQLAESTRQRQRDLYLTIFGSDPQTQKEASPRAHVGGGKGIPPFLIIHVGKRPDSSKQSRALAATLNGVGVSAQVVAAENKTHKTLNQELGKEGDPPTQAVFEFLESRERAR